MKRRRTLRARHDFHRCPGRHPTAKQRCTRLARHRGLCRGPKGQQWPNLAGLSPEERKDAKRFIETVLDEITHMILERAIDELKNDPAVRQAIERARE